MKDLKGSLHSEEYEQARLTTLNDYEILDTAPEPEFDELVNLACTFLDVPMAVIYVIGESELICKAKKGIDLAQSSWRNNSFFAQSINPNAVTGVESVPENPYHIKAYASIAIKSSDGYMLGSMCVMSDQLLDFNPQKQQTLISLANMVMDRMQLRKITSKNSLLEKQNEALILSNTNLVDQYHNLKEYQEHTAEANNVLEGVLDSYEMLFKYTPAAIGICSSGDKVIWQANEALLEILGQAKDLIGERLDLLITDIDGQDFFSIMNQVQSSATAYHAKEAKLRIKHTDGFKSLYVNLSLQPVGRMGDEPDNIMFIVADVTDQVISRQLTEEANVVLLSAIADTGMGYTIVEFATGKMTSNNQLKANYGYLADDEFNYDDLFEAILPKYRSKIKKAVRQAVTTKSIYQAEYEVKWRDGSIHWIRGYGKPMYDANGIASHIIGFNRIISGPTGDDIFKNISIEK